MAEQFNINVKLTEAESPCSNSMVERQKKILL